MDYLDDLDYGYPALLSEIVKLVEAAKPKPEDAESMVRAVAEDVFEWFRWYGDLRSGTRDAYTSDAVTDQTWLDDEQPKHPSLLAEIKPFLEDEFNNPWAPDGADFDDAVQTVYQRAVSFEDWYAKRTELEDSLD